MARGRRKGDHEAKRTEIAEAACRVFLRLGLARTSLADIAREMGYTTGVLRHYFTDKDHLLLYVKNLLFDRVAQRARAAAESADGLEKLTAMAAEYLPLDRESIDGYRLLAMFNGNAIGDPQLARAQNKRNEQHVGSFAEVIDGLQRRGILSKGFNPKVEALGILALIDGLGEQQIVRPKPHSGETLKALLERHIDSLARPRR